MPFDDAAPLPVFALIRCRFEDRYRIGIAAILVATAPAAGLADPAGQDPNGPARSASAA